MSLPARKGVVPAPRLELGRMLETGAGFGPARGLRPSALQAVAFDHSAIPLYRCSRIGCDGGARSHTLGLMRTALLPLKLRRKDVVHPARLERASAELQSAAIAFSATSARPGAPGRVRTDDLPLTRRMHWPALLREHLATPHGFEPRTAVLETAVFPATPRGCALVHRTGTDPVSPP